MFGFKVWTYKMGEQVSLMIYLGDQLGVYKTMAGSGPMTSHDVAGETDLNEQFLREWLLGQAAAGLIDRHDDGSFELTNVQAAVVDVMSTPLGCGHLRSGQRSRPRVRVTHGWH